MGNKQSLDMIISWIKEVKNENVDYHFGWSNNRYKIWEFLCSEDTKQSMYQIEENCEIIQVFESLPSNFED